MLIRVPAGWAGPQATARRSANGTTRERVVSTTGDLAFDGSGGSARVTYSAPRTAAKESASRVSLLRGSSVTNLTASAGSSALDAGAPRAPTPDGRWQSLDAVRGMTVAAMLLVNNPGS